MAVIIIPVIDLTNRKVGEAKLSAETFAISAVNNDIGLHDFQLTLNKFSAQAAALKATPEEVMKWRDEAVDIYFAELERQGKLKFDPIDLAQFGDSEGDNDDDPSLSNKLS